MAYLRGINSFGADAGSVFPGVYNTDYHYDSLASFQYYASRGHQVIRLPFKWERIQPTRAAALDPTELGRLQTAVANIGNAGMRAILDVHNYCRRVEGGVTKVLGTDFQASDLNDLWTRLSAVFNGNGTIYAYGLMNEPHDLASVAGTFSAVNTVYSFDSGVGSWKSDNSTTVAANTNASFVHDGTGSLALTRASGTQFRADDNASQAGLTESSKPALGYWVYLPAGLASGWTAHIELYNSSYSPQAGPDVPLTVGGWTQVSAVFPDALWAAHKNIAVQVNAPAALTSSTTIYIDTVQQGTGAAGQNGAQVWQGVSQGLVSAIRGAGDTTLLLVPGYGYSEIPYWTSNHPSGWITDSANNYLYDGHFYFDFSDGNNSSYPDAYAAENAAAVTAGYASLSARATTALSNWLSWLATNNAGGFLSEIGWPGGDNAGGSYTADAAAWNAVGDALYTLLDSHNIGATYWAGGEWWGYEAYNNQAYSIAQNASHSAGPVSLALAQASVIEAHNPTPVGSGGPAPVVTASTGPTTAAMAVVAPGATWNYGIDILASDEATLLENSALFDLNASDRLIGGSSQVTLDTTQQVLRTLTLSVRTSDGRYLPGATGYPSGGAGSPLATGLAWYGVRYRPWMDILTGYDTGGDPVWQRTYLGLFVLAQPQIVVDPTGATAQFTLQDKSALLQKPNVVTASNLPTYTASGGHSAGGYAKGQAVDAAMADLATRGGLPSAQLHFEPSSATLPADFPVAEGDEWWAHLATLASSISHVLYFNALGLLVRRSNPLSVNAPPVMTYAPGPQAIFSQTTRVSDLANTFNHIIVIGGSSTTKTVRGEASLQDVRSPYHKSQIGERVTFWGANGLGDMTPDPTISTTAQATTKAQTLLAQHLGQQETVTVQGRNVPWLNPYDRLSLAIPQSGLNLDVQLTQATWALANTGMTLTGSKWLAVGS